MLDGGEDSGYITRWLVRFAAEGIGVTHPQAVEQALAARALGQTHRLTDAPAHTLNALTRPLKDLGYTCDRDTVDGFSGADYFPDGMEWERFYQSTGNGCEHAVPERLAEWALLQTRKRDDIEAAIESSS